MRRSSTARDSRTAKSIDTRTATSSRSASNSLEPSGNGGKLVVSDGVFSMEGTIVDLPALVRVAKAHDAQVLIDEAHAIGVLGPDGAGTVSHFGLDDEVDLILATFSKSLASVGGVVAGPERCIHWLRHHSRALIFTASMPPSSVAGALAALDVLQQEPERRARLWANTSHVADEVPGTRLRHGAKSNTGDSRVDRRYRPHASGVAHALRLRSVHAPDRTARCAAPRLPDSRFACRRSTPTNRSSAC